MDIDKNISECPTPYTVISEYFSKGTIMDSSSDFRTKKKCNTGPKNISKSKVSKPKKPLKKIKHQKDIRTLIKNKSSELVSYSKAFDQVCKKSGVDVDSEQLQIAIALSKSLHETETKSDDCLQKSKPLTSQEKTTKIRITLQEYGFRVPNTKVLIDTNKRKRFQKQYKLLLVTDAEKKQIISDRYTEILVKNIHKSPTKNKSTSNNYNNQEIFYKGTNIPYEFLKNDDAFYVKDLFEKSPFKSCLLRDWAKIPGRPVSPKTEERNLNFDNIQCTQNELDYILSGSIYAAQSIIQSKYNVNNCNMYTNIESKIQDEANNVETNIEVFTNNEVDDVSTSNSSNIIKFDNMLTVTQNIRSASPDIFDDDISLTSDNDKNNPNQVLLDNITQSKNDVTNFMDLTKCVNRALESNNTFKKKLTIKKFNETNRKSNHFMEITECVSTSSKQYLTDNIDLTQDFIDSKKDNKVINLENENLEIDLTQSPKSDLEMPEENSSDETVVNDEYNDIISNQLTSKEMLNLQVHLENTNHLSTSPKQNIIENIDLTQSFGYSIKENSTNNLITKNLQIDLTHTNSNNIFPSLAEVSLTKADNSDNNVIVNEDSELNTNSITNKEASILQKELLFANVNHQNTIKPMNIENNNHNTLKYDEDNKSSFSEHCNVEFNLNKGNDRNFEKRLTQITNSHNELKTVDPKNVSLDKTNQISEDIVESNPILNKELLDTPKCSEFVHNDFNKSKEQNESDNYDENINNLDFYSYSENFYNNSHVFDYCHESLPKNNSQDEIVKDKTDLEDNISFDTKQPSNNSCVIINDYDKNSYNVNEKVSAEGESNTIDLTQSSPSSTEFTENQFNPKPYDTNKLGRIDNVSIDYDEMFDDVVSIGSKYTSQTSLKSNNSNDSRKANDSNNEVTDTSKTSECFDVSDKEFNYSMHQSRHNFDVGGPSIVDNVTDFETHNIKENERHSRKNLNISLNNDLPSTSVKNKRFSPKTILNSNNIISNTSTPVINKCIIKEVQNTPTSNEYIIKTQNVTPMMDYEAMTSPERNRELEKYGLKPFKRKRAIQFLKHLYEQTHPLVESCDFEQISSPSKRPKYDNDQQYNSPGKSKRISGKSPKKSPRKSPKKSPRKSPKNYHMSLGKQELKLTELDKENALYGETKGTPDVKEIKCSPEDWVFQKREKAKVHSCKVPLHIAFHNYVSCRQLLREAILRYEPINIDVIHKDLVACGYKYNPKDLLKFLDKKCITVKTVDNNKRNKK